MVAFCAWRIVDHLGTSPGCSPVLDSFFNLLIWDRERDEGSGRVGKGERKKHTLICYCTYLCIYWLFLVHALTRDGTCNPEVLGQCSNQLSNPSRAPVLSYLFPESHAPPPPCSLFLKYTFQLLSDKGVIEFCLLENIFIPSLHLIEH